MPLQVKGSDLSVTALPCCESQNLASPIHQQSTLNHQSILNHGWTPIRPRNRQDVECNSTAPMPSSSGRQTHAATSPMQKGTNSRLCNPTARADSGETENSTNSSAKSRTAAPFPASIPTSSRPALIDRQEFDFWPPATDGDLLLHPVDFERYSAPNGQSN